MRTIARIAVQRLCPSQDVLGRVVVPVGHVPTRRAGMGPDRERFLHDLPAVRAELRGEVRRYVVHPQVLHGENGVLVDVLAGRLVGMVLALAGDLEVLLSDRPGRLLVPPGALLAARNLALRPPESFRRTPETPRVLDHLSLGVGCEDLEPNVDAHGGSILRLWRLPEGADDENVPVPIGPVDEVGGLGRPFERAMLLDLEATA